MSEIKIILFINTSLYFLSFLYIIFKEKKIKNDFENSKKSFERIE